METDFLKSWSETIFKSLQPRYDGGIFSPLTQEDEVNVDLLWRWLKGLFLRSFYNVTIVIGAVWSLVIPIFLFFVLMSYCWRHYLCCFKCVRRIQHAINYCGWKCLDRKQIINELPRQEIKYKEDRKKYRTTYVILCFSVLCFFGTCAGLYYTLSGTYALQHFWTERENSTDSLTKYVDDTNFVIQDFLKTGITGANETTISMVAEINVWFRKGIRVFVTNLSNGLYRRFGITSTLNTADSVIENVIAIFDSMKFIKNNVRSLMHKVSTFKGTLDTIRPILIKQLQTECNSVTHEECQEILILANNLTVNMNWSAIDHDVSISVINLISKTNLDIHSLEKEVMKSHMFLKMTTKKNEDVAIKLLSEDDLFNSVSNLWNTVGMAVDKEAITFLNQLMEKRPEQVYIEQVSMYWRLMTDLAWSTCLAIIIVIVVIWIFTSYKTSIGWSATKHKSQKLTNLTNLQRLYNTNKALPDNVSKKKEDQNSNDQSSHNVIIHKIFRVLLSTAGIFVILPCCVTIVCFLISAVLTTEVCRYMVEPTGVDIANEKLDAFAGRIWDKEIGKFDTSNIMVPINIKRPTNILKSLFSTCRDSNASLIESLNMTGMLNVSEFTKTPTFKKVMSQGLHMTFSSFEGLPIAAMVPKELVTYIDEGVLILDSFLVRNQPKITRSVQELRKPLLKVSNYSHFIRRLASLPINDHSKLLKKSIDILKDKIPTYTSLENEKLRLMKNFMVIESNRNITIQLLLLKNMLLNSVSVLQNVTFREKELPIVYNFWMNKFADDVILHLNSRVRSLEQTIFPCRPLHDAYSIVMRAFCGVSRSGISYFALVLAITVLWLQVTFLFSWCLVSTLNPPFEPDNCTNC